MSKSLLCCYCSGS